MEGGESGGAFGVLGEGAEHELRGDAGDEVDDGARDGCGDQAGSGAEAGE